MNITLGVPRLKEIINAVKNISTPIITTTLKNEFDETIARIIKGRIEKTYLKDICEYIKEVVSSKGCYLSVKISAKTIDILFDSAYYNQSDKIQGVSEKIIVVSEIFNLHKRIGPNCPYRNRDFRPSLGFSPSQEKNEGISYTFLIYVFSIFNHFT